MWSVIDCMGLNKKTTFPRLDRIGTLDRSFTICLVSLTAVYCHHTDEWNILLPLLGGGASGADERHNDDHDHSDGSHGNHYDDQEVAVLLRSNTAVRWTHLTNGRLWNTHKRKYKLPSSCFSLFEWKVYELWKLPAANMEMKPFYSNETF